jgi:dihydropteroate synthase
VDYSGVKPPREPNSFPSYKLAVLAKMTLFYRVLQATGSEIARRELARLSIVAPDLAVAADFQLTLISGLDAPSAAALAGVVRSIGGAAEAWEQRPEHGVLLASTSVQMEASLELLTAVGRGALANAISTARRRWAEPRGTTRCGSLELLWGRRTYIMGIINATPDSFSGDGLGLDVDAALRQAEAYTAQGADILDVGGESTRPGHLSVSTDEEIERVIPVIEKISCNLAIPISVDTSKAAVAAAALAAGALMVNDVWGLKKDPGMARLVAVAGVPVIVMHNQEGTSYHDLMGDLITSLQESIDMALDNGVLWDNIIVDPGFGFGKTKEHNLEFMARLSELKVLGRPILLGPSRKSTIGYVLDLPVDQRLEGTAALAALGIAGGADILRVHDVEEMARVCRMADAVARSPWHVSS